MFPAGCKGWRIQVTTVDRHTIEGAFVASDDAGNLLLKDAEEQCADKKPRHLGFVGLRGSAILCYVVLSHR